MFSPKLHESKILFLKVPMIVNVNKYLATLLYKHVIFVVSVHNCELCSASRSYLFSITCVQVITQARVLYLIDM